MLHICKRAAERRKIRVVSILSLPGWRGEEVEQKTDTQRQTGKEWGMSQTIVHLASWATSYWRSREERGTAEAALE